MGVRNIGKKKVINTGVGMAGKRIGGQNRIDISDGSRILRISKQPGKEIGYVITRLQSLRLSRTA